MTAREMTAPPAAAGPSGPGFGLFVLLVGALTAVRIAGLHLSAVDLYFDESQYWAWSQELAFGYFSKPPLIAFVIAAADAICGSGKACLRAPAPLFYFGMALAVYLAARPLYGSRTAFFAGLTAVLAPGIVFSSRIISTDVPLLFFWAVALLAFVRLRAGGGFGWSLLLAVAFGLGLLSKYAMVYFAGCAIAAGLVDPASRALLKSARLWLALGLGLLFLVPNLLWNLDHGLATFVHTGTNIAGRGALFDVGGGLEFLAAQFAVGGPVVMAGLLFLAVRFRSPLVTADDRMLLAFSLPILAALVVFAFVTEANGNWAAPAFVSGFIVVPAVLLRLGRRGLVVAGIAIGLACQAALLIADPFADRLSLPLAKPVDPYAPTLGWKALGQHVTAAAKRSGAGSIVGVPRRDVASLIYYTRDSGLPVFAWPPDNGIPGDHFELTRPLGPGAPEPVLAVGGCRADDRLATLFATVVRAGSFRVPTGPTSSRRYCLALLSGRKP
jgi:4-amino-4-deoxy-L-arabinose transferase-like glycosyltransferase